MNEEITLSEALAEISYIKSDLGDALNAKGMTVTDEFASFPVAVNSSSNRILQLPSNQVETITTIKGCSLYSSYNVWVDASQTREARPNSIWVNDNGVLSPISANDDLSISYMESPVGEDLAYLSGLNYNTGTALLALNQTKTQLQTWQAANNTGWVQYKVSDSKGLNNYYVNILARNLNPSTDISNTIVQYSTDTESGYPTNYLPDVLDLGDYEYLNFISEINRINKIGDVSTSLNYVNDNDFAGRMNLLNAGDFSERGYDVDHVTLTTSDDAVATISFTPAHKMLPANWTLHVIAAGTFNLVVTLYDSNDNVLNSFTFPYTVEAFTPEFTYDGADPEMPIPVPVEVTYDSDLGGYTWTNEIAEFSINLDANFDYGAYDINNSSNWSPDMGLQAVPSADDGDCALTGNSLELIDAMEDGGMISLPSGVQDGDVLTRRYDLTFEATDETDNPNILALKNTSITFYVQYEFLITQAQSEEMPE